jgi:hypothetical protein
MPCQKLGPAALALWLAATVCNVHRASGQGAGLQCTPVSSADQLLSELQDGITQRFCVADRCVMSSV